MQLYKFIIPLCVSCGGAQVGGSLDVDAPSLAYVAPGVEVVADWDAPVFFADDFYWWLDGGLWYRSERLGGDRVLDRNVPPAIARLRNPEGYSHFHPGGVAYRPIPDHREYGSSRAASSRSASPSHIGGGHMGGGHMGGGRR